MSDTILLTGFEPFADHAVNPTARIAAALDGKTIDGVRIIGRVLPVVRRTAWPMLAGWLDEVGPAAVLATGVSDRPRVSIERVARNVDDDPIPDNAGVRVTAQLIVGGAPRELHTPLDLAAMRDALWLDGDEADLSDDAGAYLCNHVYYRLLHDATTRPAPHRPAAFIHLPRVPRGGCDPRGDRASGSGGDPLEHLPVIVHALAWLAAWAGVSAGSPVTGST